MINLILCSLEKAAFSRAYSLYAIFSDIIGIACEGC